MLLDIETEAIECKMATTRRRDDDINKFKVGCVPTVFYIPDFISDSHQKQLLNHIYTAPVSKWKSLKNRRLQNWGGIVHEKGLLPQDLPPWLTNVTEKISNQSSLFPSAINHVLINEYLPNQGIMPHQDGPAYFPVVAILSLGSPVVMDFTPHPSLAGCTSNTENRGIIEGTDHVTSPNHDPFSIALMPRSLLIFKDMVYTDYLHGINDCEIQPYDTAVNATEVSPYQSVNETHDEDLKAIHRSTTRVSLTCRVVSKVHRNLFRF
uniref:alpha-ketoglutarate-dependent dioxygenase alkB homolog 6 n=1 Tax=Erigeron canadensis TaxID=72917 RepID=UPI001CB90BFC|nr:alpha-ketoglutarate-dependent dioxygenase alkB homolog 6 [Erigeron canadensis]